VDNARNISAKSGLSTRLPLHGPRFDRERPHHVQPLGNRPRHDLILGRALAVPEDASRPGTPIHWLILSRRPITSTGGTEPVHMWVHKLIVEGRKRDDASGRTAVRGKAKGCARPGSSPTGWRRRDRQRRADGLEP
jgi:hypothetical protein